VSNLEWDVYMAILRDRSDDPSVWARNKLQQMADRIHALTAERDEARRIASAQYVKRFSILEVSYETNKNEDQLTKNFYELHGWEYVKGSQNIQFFVGDDDHAKEGL